jgi:hypothetical protein
VQAPQAARPVAADSAGAAQQVHDRVAELAAGLLAPARCGKSSATSAGM